MSRAPSTWRGLTEGLLNEYVADGNCLMLGKGAKSGSRGRTAGGLKQRCLAAHSSHRSFVHTIPTAQMLSPGHFIAVTGASFRSQLKSPLLGKCPANPFPGSPNFCLSLITCGPALFLLFEFMWLYDYCHGLLFILFTAVLPVPSMGCGTQ